MSGFKPYPKSGGSQNVRSKATPAADGRARSTEPKGFKRPTKPTLGRAREHRDRPEAVEGEEDFDLTPPKPQSRTSAAGFARATDLRAPAVAEHRRATDPDAPRTRIRPGTPAEIKAWRDEVFRLWFPGWTEESEDEVPCPVTGDDLCAGWSAHHIIEAKVLWHHGLAARVVEVVDRRTGEMVAAPAINHPFVGMPISDRANLGFEDGSIVIPRSLIPERTWDLARALDELDPLAGPSWATSRLEADYPDTPEHP